MVRHTPVTATHHPRRRRRLGTGPPAALVITWALLSDPALRSALEFAAVTAETARHRVHTTRRRALAVVMTLALLGTLARVVLWSVG